MEQALREKLAALSPVEKTEAIQLLMAEFGSEWPGIEKNPGVCGGDACVVRTRIPVWLPEQMRRFGVTEPEILIDYPTPNREDILNAWSYAQAHLDEINDAIADNEALEEELN